MTPTLPDDLWRVVSEFLPVRDGFLASRACKSLRLALLRHRHHVTRLPYHLAKKVGHLVRRFKTSEFAWPAEPLRIRLMRAAETNDIRVAYEGELTNELYHAILEDVVETFGWRGIRRHLDAKYVDHFGINEPHDFSHISRVERRRLVSERRKRKREEELQDFEDNRQSMKRASERVPRG